MSNNKPIIAAILTLVVMYLAIAFFTWELNAGNWHIKLRLGYALVAPIVSILTYQFSKK